MTGARVAAVAVVCANLSGTTSLAAQAKPLPEAELERLVGAAQAGRLRDVTASCTTGLVSVAEGAMRFGLIGASVQALRHARNSGMQQYFVTVSGRRGWIVQQLFDAVRQGRSVTRADISPEWQRPALYLRIEPANRVERLPGEPDVPVGVTGVKLRGYDEVGFDRRLEVSAATLSASGSSTPTSPPAGPAALKVSVATFEPKIVQRFWRDEVFVVVDSADGSRDCALTTGQLKRLLKDR